MWMQMCEYHEMQEARLVEDSPNRLVSHAFNARLLNTLLLVQFIIVKSSSEVEVDRTEVDPSSATIVDLRTNPEDQDNED